MYRFRVFLATFELVESSFGLRDALDSALRIALGVE